MDQHSDRHSRRDFLRLGGAGFLVTATASGCSFFSTAPASEDGGGQAAAGPKGKEAPMLAKQVKEGKLPPVEERLPKKPMVVEPNSKMGVYGGEWTSAIMGTADWPWLIRTVGYEWLQRWTVDWTSVIPNLAESYEYNSDATAVTYRLREGLKWSDGEPFTADDILFAQNDLFNNEEVYPAVKTQPQPTAEKHDDVTVTIHLPQPDATYVSYDLSGFQVCNKPKHYLKQFHKKYNSNADKLAKEQGFDSWVGLLDNKCGITDFSTYWQNPDMPSVFAWKMVEALGEGGRVLLERNPYYFKTDPEGSQLPYLDRVIFTVIPEEQAMLTRALNGDFNMHMRHFNNLQNKPVLAKNRKRGNYKFFGSKPSMMNTSMIALNLTSDDDVKREVFQNKNFRIGLSHAVNRKEIIDVVYQQQGEAWQGAPRSDAPFFNERLAKQYTEYDTKLANDFLDRAGYTQRDGNGMRLGPDDQTIAFTVDVAQGFRPDHIDVMELVRKYWRAVGIDVSVETIGRSLFYERKEANKSDATVWTGDNGLLDAIEDPRWYFPYQQGESNFAIPWATWYQSNGKNGKEPPEPAKEQMSLYDRLLATPKEKDRFKVMDDILDISQEFFYAIGITLEPSGYGIVGNKMRNVPGTIYASGIYNNPGPTNPEQYFIKT